MQGQKCLFLCKITNSAISVNTYSSRLLEQCVNELARLPGIGRKTALRLALHMLKQEDIAVENLTGAISDMKSKINYCKICNNLSDGEICQICDNPKRDRELVCVVSDIRDILAIEKTAQFGGVYHVLNGIISPIDGIGPGDLNIDALVKRVADGGIREIIFALSSTIEGDTTSYYIFKKISQHNVSVSTIARGISVGDELEYADEVTLGRSIMNRMPYQSGLK
ncbi:MAG: recombination protein RecR [Bacteroidetes bacterium]|nr:MAG: recombination protein RecR [Bacteroidota bacterium]